MTNTVERLAQAMFGQEEWHLLDDRARLIYFDMAARTLRAMREPTPEMVDGALDALDANPKAGVQAIWRAMVDAALAESES